MRGILELTSSLSLFLGSPTTGRPFTARFEEVHLSWAQGRSVRELHCGTLARDSQGRTRAEFGGDCESDSPVAIVLDPVEGTGCFLELATNRIIQMIPVTSVAPEAADGTSDPGTPEHGVRKARPEDLGTRDIEGRLCRGERVRFETGSTVFEKWWTSELDQPLVEITHTPGEERTFRLFNLRFVEPDPAFMTCAGRSNVAD